MNLNDFLRFQDCLLPSSPVFAARRTSFFDGPNNFRPESTALHLFQSQKQIKVQYREGEFGFIFYFQYEYILLDLECHSTQMV